MTAAIDHGGPCARCGDPGAVNAYWGDRLCRPCCQIAAEYLDARDAWPPLPAEDQSELDALGEAGVNR